MNFRITPGQWRTIIIIVLIIVINILFHNNSTLINFKYPYSIKNIFEKKSQIDHQITEVNRKIDEFERNKIQINNLKIPNVEYFKQNKSNELFLNLRSINFTFDLPNSIILLNKAAQYYKLNFELSYNDFKDQHNNLKFSNYNNTFEVSEYITKPKANNNIFENESTDKLEDLNKENLEQFLLNNPNLGTEIQGYNIASFIINVKGEYKNIQKYFHLINNTDYFKIKFISLNSPLLNGEIEAIAVVNIIYQ